MAKTLLDGVNETLKRAQVISDDLAGLTSGGKQVSINIAIQAWNEVMEDIYSISETPKPKEIAEDTITLATGTRNYALASDLNQLLYPLLDETNGQYITEYPGGYTQMVFDQLVPSNETGLPLFGAIRETDGQFYVDKSPTANENGNIYKYRYSKDVSVSIYTDTFPFSDAVFRALVPATVQIYKQQKENSFDEGIYHNAMGKAVRYLLQKKPRDSWLPLTGSTEASSDPYAK